jgi:general secretion pathway protein H
MPRGTSRPRLEAFALEAASLIRSDRNAAIRRRTEVATMVNVAERSVRSGVTGQAVRLPADVKFQATLAARCNGRNTGVSINFLPSGMSCGGSIVLTRLESGYEVRVNWLTGGVEVVPFKAS